jgi:hypothetical protein
MPEIVKTPISSFEVEMEYVDPIIKLWVDPSNALQAIFAALKPWNIRIDDVELLTVGKASERGPKFKLPQKQSSFFFGPGSCKFTRDNTNWSIAEETIQILGAALSAFVEHAGAVIANYKTAIVLHIQPKTSVPFMQLLGPLIPHQLSGLERDAASAMAIVVKWHKRRMTIDNSAHVANGIFLRFEREFGGDTSFEEIAMQLKADEDQVFNVLKVQEEQ